MTPATITPAVRPASSPRTGLWQIDPARAVVAFSGKASFLAPTIRARFLGVEGCLTVDEIGRRLSGTIDVSVDVTTLTTGNSVWDDVISTFDPFEAALFPLAVYRSTGMTWTDDGQAVVDGSLTLRGVASPVPLTASYDVGRTGTQMLVRAAGSIDRAAFGISFDVPGCGKLVPRVMRLEIDIDAHHTA